MKQETANKFVKVMINNEKTGGAIYNLVDLLPKKTIFRDLAVFVHPVLTRTFLSKILS